MNIFKDYYKIETPVVALSPMDGVTDNAFRFITKKYGNPDLLITEFVNVNAMAVGQTPVYTPLAYDESQRPIIAQIYGSEPELFYSASIIAAELGFDGIDINMGCPSKNVANSGSGAALIQTPEKAKDIVRAAKKGVQDWLSGRSYKDLDIKERNKETIGIMVRKPAEKRELPVSVKTRIGYDSKIAAEWVKHLSDVGPAFISIHGRTLKQMYRNEADWEQIAKAVEAADGIPILGNGDIQSSNDAVKRIKETRVTGVLIGRAAFGNPWIFKQKEEIKGLKEDIQDYIPTFEELEHVMIEHCEKFLEDKPDPRQFVEMRKHLGWYMKGFPGAKTVRAQLVQVSSLEEVKNILKEVKKIYGKE